MTILYSRVKLGKRQTQETIMIVDFKDLGKIREKHSAQKIVLGSGTFDLTHAGHVLFFEDCKRFGDVLVVMVGSDQAIQRFKGKDRPVINEYARLKVVDSLKPVDYTFLDCYVDRDDFLVFLLDEAFKFLKPDTYVVNADGYDISFRRKLAKKHGVELVVLPRTAPKEFENISTTKIIEKMKRLKN